MPFARAMMLAGAAVALGAAAPHRPAPVKAWIEVEQNAAGQRRYLACVSAQQPLRGRFELVGERRGAGGTSTVRQSGQVAAEPGGTTRLSQISFGGSSAGTYSVRLKIFVGDELVGQVEAAS